MAKKRATAKKTEKSRVELRLDERATSGIKRLADGAGITVNQLMNGMALWASENGHIGEPVRDEEGVLNTKVVEGVLWFGKPGYRLGKEDIERYEAADVDGYKLVDKGEKFFVLDYTERRILRE